MYPTHLEKHIKKIDNQCVLSSSDGDENLEIWYYGDIFIVKSENLPYIVDTDEAPCRIIAKAKNGEEFLIFDNALHGYNAMFCDEFSEDILENRPLTKWKNETKKIFVEIGYGIDYEDEKEDYDLDENNMVTLIDGPRLCRDVQPKTHTDKSQNSRSLQAVCGGNTRSNRVLQYFGRIRLPAENTNTRHETVSVVSHKHAEQIRLYRRHTEHFYHG